MYSTLQDFVHTKSFPSLKISEKKNFVSNAFESNEENRVQRRDDFSFLASLSRSWLPSVLGIVRHSVALPVTI